MALIVVVFVAIKLLVVLISPKSWTGTLFHQLRLGRNATMY